MTDEPSNVVPFKRAAQPVQADEIARAAETAFSFAQRTAEQYEELLAVNPPDLAKKRQSLAEYLMDLQAIAYGTALARGLDPSHLNASINKANRDGLGKHADAILNSLSGASSGGAA